MPAHAALLQTPAHHLARRFHGTAADVPAVTAVTEIDLFIQKPFELNMLRAAIAKFLPAPA